MNNTVSVNVNGNFSASFDETNGVLEISGTGSVEGTALINAFPGINLPERVKKIITHGEKINILDKCFSNFSCLETAILTDVMWIKAKAFENCDSLRRVDFSDSLEFIGRSAFECCSALRSIQLPDSMKHAHPYTFAYCDNLQSVILPSGLEELPQDMFLCCSELRSVKISEGTKNLGDHTFSGCGNIETVFLPSTLCKADYSGLSQKRNIKDVYYNGTPEDFIRWLTLKKGALFREVFLNSEIYFNSPEKKVTKIVLTGGPCGGKTAALSRIRDAYSEKGYAVVIVPETATELISGGISPVTLGSVTEFQKSVLRAQLRKEDLVQDNLKHLYSDKVLIVCDRGAVDNMAYLSADRFKEVFECTGTSKEQLISRYDAVFQLQTAANGALEYYTTANNSARSEKPEDAVLLDKRIEEVWSEHPYFRIFDNSTDFAGKLERLIKEIDIFLEENR